MSDRDKVIMLRKALENLYQWCENNVPHFGAENEDSHGPCWGAIDALDTTRERET